MMQTELLTLERAALISLLSFVEKKYPILKNHLSTEYLLLHIDSEQCLKQEPPKDEENIAATLLQTRFLRAQVLFHVEQAFSHFGVLEATKTAFEIFKSIPEHKTTDFYAFQNKPLLAPESEKSYFDKPVKLKDDIALLLKIMQDQKDKQQKAPTSKPWPTINLSTLTPFTPLLGLLTIAMAIKMYENVMSPSTIDFKMLPVFENMTLPVKTSFFENKDPLVHYNPWNFLK